MWRINTTASIASYLCISKNLRHRLCRRRRRPRYCPPWAAEDPMNLVDRHLSPPIYGPCALARMNLWTKTCRSASFGAELSTVNIKITFKYNDPIRAYIRFCASVLAPTHLRLLERDIPSSSIYKIPTSSTRSLRRFLTPLRASTPYPKFSPSNPRRPPTFDLLSSETKAICV